VCTEPREEHIPSSPGIWSEKWISDFEDQIDRLAGIMFKDSLWELVVFNS